MTVSILKLPDQLINQIAAGEVVESPASCIKELIENSIDAGSTYIDVSIKSGGYLSIIIQDNGHGINEDQVLIAFERHTTSKLFSFDDLQSHLKMGFRGEALASIASCSRLCIKTSTKDGQGIVCDFEGGQLIKKTAASLKKGTTIEIRDLFFNTPARKKFQKSIQSSIVEIQKLLLTLIFAHPKVNFVLKSEQNTLIEAPCDLELSFKQAFRKRIYDFFSHVDVDKGRFLEMSDPLMSVMGFLAPLETPSHNRKNQYFFVNARPIESFALSFAIQEALKTYFPEKKFFQGVFHIDIDPKWIDINIHPQKKEIRFQEEGYVKDLLQRLVTPELESQFKFHPQPIPCFESSYQMKITPKESQTSMPEVPSYFYRKTLGYYSPYLLIDAEEIPELLFQKGIVLFDVKQSFIEKKIHTFLTSNRSLESQQLLLSIPLDLSQNDLNQVKQNLKLFEQLGFRFADNYELTAHPFDLDEREIKKVIFDVLYFLHQSLSFKDLINFIFESIYHSKVIPIETTQSILNDAILQNNLSKFCHLSDSKLKSLFYEQNTT